MHNLERPVASRAFLLSCVSTVAAAMLFATNAFAAIQGYRTFKGAGYEQTSNAQPTTPVGFSADVDIIFDDPGDFTSAEVTSPSPLSPMTLDIPSPGFAWFPGGYATAAERDTDFPADATYEFEVMGGSLGTISASLTTPAENLFPDVPYFTGTTYDLAQNMNPAIPFQFNFNGYAAPPGTNDAPIFIGISRVSDGQSAFGLVLPNTETSFVLPAGTLEPDTSYEIVLVYSARINVPDAGFNGATSTVGFDLRTDLSFTTAPEPSAIALASFGVLTGIAVTWRKRRVAS